MNLFTKISSLLLLILLQNSRCQLQYPPSGFFSTSDVTKLTWAHGVNSQEALMASLKDPAIRMLEADLCRGRLLTDGEIGPVDMVVMAHPPTRTSDLSFVDFIDTVIDYNKDRELKDIKGVKLDFKDYYAAVRAVLVLRARNTTEPLKFPVWLNADVVKGPVNSTSEPKIKGVDLLRLQDLNLPSAVLSLGWTTRYGMSGGELIDSGEYTREQVDEMIQVFKDFAPDKNKRDQIPVTFAVRAAIAERSLANMLYLLNSTSSRASLTFWSGANDPPSNLELWDDFFKLVGRNRLFIDVFFDWERSSGNNIKFSFKIVALFLISYFLL